MNSTPIGESINTVSNVSNTTMTGGKTQPPEIDAEYLAFLRQQLGLHPGETRATKSRNSKRAPARKVEPRSTWASFGNATTFDPNLLLVERTQEEASLMEHEVEDQADEIPTGGGKKKRSKKKGKAKMTPVAGKASGLDITPADMKYLDEIRQSYPVKNTGLEAGSVKDTSEATTVSVTETPRSQATRFIPRRSRRPPSSRPDMEAGSYLDPSKTDLQAIKVFHQECVATDFYAAVKSETQLFDTLKKLMPSGSQNTDWAKMSSEVKSDSEATEAFVYHIDDKYAKLSRTISEARTWGDTNGLQWGWVARPCRGAPPKEPDSQTEAKSNCPLYGGQPSAKAVCQHQVSKLTDNLKWFRQQYDDSLVLTTSRSAPPSISIIPRHRYNSYVSAARAVHARRVATAMYALTSADAALWTELNRLIPPGTTVPWADLCEAVRSDSDAEKKLKDFFEEKEPKLASAYKAAHGWGSYHGLPVRSFVLKACGSDQSTSVPDMCPTKVAQHRTAEVVCGHQLSNASFRVNKVRPLWQLYTAETKAANETAPEAPISDDGEPADTAGTEEPSTASTRPTDA